MPTFLFFKEGKEVDRLVGANKVELQKITTKHGESSSVSAWGVISYEEMSVCLYLYVLEYSEYDMHEECFCNWKIKVCFSVFNMVWNLEM